ncbi:hypothetical protein EB796_018670 [Bugula neritina]|uniref:BTB domain-containing protein n=1 Tax=Bugula neritina TaxID=10212 RepID=A0A7J7JCE2_BUGNE|nr:hypothetical protein EB796_018670 [Bugula neritina]
MSAEKPICKGLYSYEHADDMTNAVILVEGKELHVVKELLMVASPVFKAMFTGHFIEASTNVVELANKDINHIVWMLDYIYPEKVFDLTDEMAAKLLPLAEEYQLSNLRAQCIDVLLEQDTPRLEIVTLAEKFGLEELLEVSINQCAQHVQAEPDTKNGKESELDQQLKLPENSRLSKDAVNKILRKKIYYAKMRFAEIKTAVNGILAVAMRTSKSDQDAIRKHKAAMSFGQGIF